MAEKILNTRILMKIDTLENWSTSTLKLKEGELAFATVAASAGTGLEEPVVMVKIGTAEEKTFSELPWAFHAKAADVLAACKSEDSLKSFINGVIADAGIASDDAMQELAGKVTTAEGKITTLEGEMDAVEAKAAANESAIATLESLVGTDKNVATQISDAIAALDLANTYEAKGEAAKVQTALDTYKTANDAAVQKNATDIAGEIARAKAAEEANANAISTIKDGTTLDSFADVETALAGKEAAGEAAKAQAAAEKHADDLNSAMNTRVEALEAIDHDHTNKAELDKIADGDKAKWDAMEQNAKDYTDAEIEEWVGDKTVGVQISEAIAAEKLAETYEAKGAAAQALIDAKAHANGLDSAMNTRVAALEAIDHDHANKAELDLIEYGDKAKWDAMEQNAKDYADGLDEVMDGRVAALEAKFGDGEGNVEAQIAAAVAAEAEIARAAEKANADAIDAIEADYLKSADKEELQDAIDALEVLVGTDKSVSEQIAAVTTPIDERLAAVEADYLKAADKKELQDQIDANESAIELLTNGVSSEEVDGVNDLIQYVKEHGTEVTGIKADIQANADAIDAIEADYLKAADKTELSGLIGGLDTRMGAAETAIGTKAAQADLEALAGRVTTVEGDLNTETTGLKAKMAAAEAAIEALEGKHAEGTVAEQIAAVTNPIDERVQALEAIDHEHANKTVLDSISADQVAAWDVAVQTVTAGTGLTATKTGTDVAIAFDDSVTFIFDCGTSAV